MDENLRMVNMKESGVPDYVLPDPLTCMDGSRVKNINQWLCKRRPEILSLFAEHVYGLTPREKPEIKFHVESADENALNGKAVRKQISINLSFKDRKYSIDMLLYVPRRKLPAPVFLGLNFWGNHSVHSDPEIKISTKWYRPGGAGVEENRATAKGRGVNSENWQVEKILDSGFAFAALSYADLEADHPEGWKDGVRAFLHPEGKRAEFKPSDWGSIGAWAWGLSRAMDYLEQDADIDHKKTALIGHSRLGKTALWAGAQDERFKIVLSNNSGCGGAALSRRLFGENLQIINSAFPHWFCGNFKKYNNHEDELPVDQHELISLIAPRPVYIASAAEDLWADPRGEFLSAKNAEPVYELFGKTGTKTKVMPEINKSVGEFIGYHLRTGKHGLTGFDWEQYIAFAVKHLK